jgi:hypothetical protein
MREQCSPYITKEDLTGREGYYIDAAATDVSPGTSSGFD